MGYNSFATPRLADAIRRMYGEDVNVDMIAAELQMVSILENDRFENRYTQLVRNWSTGSVPVGAAVGNLSRLQIHNPPNSGLLVVVQGFICTNPPAAGSYVVSRDGALAGAPTANLATDTRVPINASSRKVGSLNRIDNTLPAVGGEILCRRNTLINVDVVFNFLAGPEQPIVLVPNTVCEVVNATANQAITALAFGYDRPARAEELAIA